MNLLYTLAWRDPGAEADARKVYSELRNAVAGGARFPYDCPYEIGLARSRSSNDVEWVIVVLVLRGTLLDDFQRAETINQLESWFKQIGASETRGGSSRVADHLKLSSELGLEYELDESFGTFVGEPEPVSALKVDEEPVKEPVEAESSQAVPPVKSAVQMAEELSRPLITPPVDSPPTRHVEISLPPSSFVPPPAAPNSGAITCLGAGLAGMGLFIGAIGLLAGLLFVIGQYGTSDPAVDMGQFLWIMSCFPLPIMAVGALMTGIGIYFVWRARKKA